MSNLGVHETDIYKTYYKYPKIAVQNVIQIENRSTHANWCGFDVQNCKVS